MIDQRLEARLRLDPDNDPRHQVGLIWTRLAATAVPRARPVRRPIAYPLGVAVLVALMLAAVLVVGRLVTLPEPTPGPSPSPTPTAGASVTIQAVLDEWQAGLPRSPAVSLSVWASTGGQREFSAGTFPTPPRPEGQLARIGEVSRLLVAVAVVHAHVCTLPAASLDCEDTTPGLISFDDRVGDWLTDWQPGDPTTIDQLLHGTSGLAPVGGSLAEVQAAIDAQPGTDWSRAAALARAVAAPRRFPPGSQVAPVDTESMVLEDVLQAATGRSFFQTYPIEVKAFDLMAAEETDTIHPPFMPGLDAGGRPLADLDPRLVAALGNAAGQGASSRGLASVALTAYGGDFHWAAPEVAYLTDGDNGRVAPPAATGYCPCDGGTRLVIAATGHAIAWSALLAYDFRDGVAIGVAVGTDVSDAELGALRDGIVAALAAT